MTKQKAFNNHNMYIQHTILGLLHRDTHKQHPKILTF